MDYYTITVVALALAMDALAVALATGIHLKTVSWRQTFRLAWHFGFFQAMMPVIGWSAGLGIRTYMERYAHWVAFGLLAFVGGNMLKEAFAKDAEQKSRQDPTRGMTMVMLSTATSIDALAVGLSMSMLKLSIWLPAAIIGLVALVLTAAGLHLGRIVSATPRLCRYASAGGGIVLLVIGFKILIEHGAVTF